MIKRKDIKVILIGNTGVGKTSIAYWLTYKRHCSVDPSSTIGASFFIKVLPYKNREVKLNIWDTAGQERFKSIVKMYYKNSSACLCIFDVTNRSSFDSLQSWISDYENNNNSSKYVIYIVANKCDYPEEKWEISKKDIQNFSKKMGIKIFYTSYLTGMNIELMFNQLVIDVIEHVYTPDDDINNIVLVQDNEYNEYNNCKC